VGGGNVDWFKEFGYETETVSGSVQELAVLCDLIRGMLTQDGAVDDAETNLL
jgi:hypothetical protein